jgi:protein-S-isoprenylcysteine O-methyltransferase Ste14
MQRSRLVSYTLVAIQFACLFAIVLSGTILARNPMLLAVEVAALLLGVWAILSVRIGNVNVLPDPRQEAVLVQSGPYRWIRHPMYAALLLGTLALVLDLPSALHWSLWIALLVDLVIKLHYEERMLRGHFEEYGAYMAGSKRLIPYLY